MWKECESIGCCYGLSWKKGNIIITYDGGWRWKYHDTEISCCTQYCAEDLKSAKFRAEFFNKHKRWNKDEEKRIDI